MTDQKLPGRVMFFNPLTGFASNHKNEGAEEGRFLTPAQLADYAKQQRAIGFEAGKSSNCIKMTRHGDLIDEETYPTLADFEASLAEQDLQENKK